jgi:hypothetical protein
MVELIDSSFLAEQAGDITGYSGGRTGVFSPGREAAAVLGETDYGQIFAYLFRRFGFPRFGCDPHKQLVEYILTTPMEGVLLTASPGSDTWLSFGHLLSPDLFRATISEEQAEIAQWHSGLEAWAAKQGITLLNRWDDPPHPGLEEIKSRWLAEHHPGAEIAEAIMEEFWGAQEAIYEARAQEYRDSAGPLPSPFEYPPDSLRERCNQALRVAIADLLRPVFVRDVLINICGPVEAGGDLPRADYSHMAGFGVTTEVYDDPDAWFEFVAKARRVGGGDLLAGLQGVQWFG